MGVGAAHGPPHLFGQLRQRLSALRSEGGKERPHESRRSKIIYWLAGHNQKSFRAALASITNFEDSSAQAPKMSWHGC